ncbi:c-type cytochrome biogenesis protein CcmI [Brevundimonas sp. SORGH_AS_0993]|uniref:c-type cytochrome biogenesis protein CcmI n=1 Tax=Brevundimonas sp. SORGH_AS_0993 TaxID=3041794 RepID=UPI0027833257|nr:c-type cytochrome biogenesis protein CcmI [Brevundimonas sp. SORGH_AS_0993]MDQ1155538.1 cytochrome c-type biogenesis protein CcmH [Brevundimonas sp. SORGH_AS_0993]
MIAFWMMTGLAAALAALLVMAGARRGADPATSAESAAAVREIEELDRLKARGLLDEAAYVAARAEAGRRLLAQEAAAAPVVGARDRLWVMGGLGLVVAGALGLYVVTGTPGLPDQGYEHRVDDWSTRLETLSPPQLAAVAARVVRDRPDDKQALAMLGAARFAADDPLGAASAFRRLIDRDPKDAQAWARLGESLVRANDGQIGGDAEAAFAQAVRLDPDQLGARFFLGEAALARGDAQTTRLMWTPLIGALDPADPRRLDLERRMPSDGAAGGAR